MCDGSAHSSGCVVNGSNVMAIIVYTLRNNYAMVGHFQTLTAVCAVDSVQQQQTFSGVRLIETGVFNPRRACAARVL